jgi:hypothetical protein
VIVLQFLARTTDETLSGAITRAEALAGLAEPGALGGLTDAEKSQVVNFHIPMQP